MKLNRDLRIRFALPILMTAISMALMSTDYLQRHAFHRPWPGTEGGFPAISDAPPPIQPVFQWYVVFNSPALLMSVPAILVLENFGQPGALKDLFVGGIVVSLVWLQWFWVGRNIDSLWRFRRPAPSRLPPVVSAIVFVLLALLFGRLIGTSMYPSVARWVAIPGIAWCLYGVSMSALRWRFRNFERISRAKTQAC